MRGDFMQSIIDSIYVDGNILLTMVKLFVFAFSLDFLLSFASAIKSIKNSVF